MYDVIKILTLKNELEANLIKEILIDQKIPFNIKSFYDHAYDGIFQVQYGWGIIEAPKKYKNKILNIYRDLSIKKSKKNNQ